MADIENNVINLAERVNSLRTRLAFEDTESANLELAELRTSLHNLAVVMLIAEVSQQSPTNYEQINATLDGIALELHAIMAALGMS